MKYYFQNVACCLSFLLIASSNVASATTVRTVAEPSPRAALGAQRLIEALKAVGIEANIDTSAAQHQIVVGKISEPQFEKLISDGQLKLDKSELKPQGFALITTPDGSTAVCGADDSGTLYGCLELAKRIREAKRLPDQLKFIDAPSMVMRGTCVAMQKTYKLPGRGTYEYPYTPELFPFFYDKAQWNQYLDFLLANRMNTLYLWNGHPFASLVRVPDYPEAVEVPDDIFERNQEMFKYVVDEADRRGIVVMQMFYNIIVSKPFATKNTNGRTQFDAPTPIVSDYTRKSIAEFVKTYPKAGLMVCLGEALKGDDRVDPDRQAKWMTDVIVPGIHDGMAAAGIKEEIPVLLRAHAMPAERVVPQTLKVYKNLYTETKYNGESLTTHDPRGADAASQQMLASLGQTHLVNVHILSNLEPFRYGSQRFIKLCVQAAEDVDHARGIHLYPLSYWNWPDTPDKVETPLKQIDRDWIWFEAWSRYAWNPRIDEAADHEYWVQRIGDMYGSAAAGEKILSAYNDAGECAPRIIRRFGITEGNRQTMALGMTLDQLVNPARFTIYPILWESWAPLGERLHDTHTQGFNTLGYVTKEFQHLPHEGETPPQVIQEILDFSKNAVDAIDAAAPLVTKNTEEYSRIRNDMHCIRALSQHYAAKANAAMCVLRFNLSNDVQDMVAAEKYLNESVEHYRELTRLTTDTYKFANSMQTGQRRVPLSGGGPPPGGGQPTNSHWSQILPVYEKELTDFHKRVDTLKRGAEAAKQAIQAWPAVKFSVLTAGAEVYDVDAGATVFTDDAAKIKTVAPELKGLKGIRYSQSAMLRGDKLEIETASPALVLVGYIKGSKKGLLQVPNLDADAAAAETIDVVSMLSRAVTLVDSSVVDVHTVKLDKGKHELDLRGSGAYLILGVIPADAKIQRRDANPGN